MSSASDGLHVLRSVHPDLELDTAAKALAELGTVVGALPYRALYWPDIIEVHGAIFVDLFGVGVEFVDERVRDIVSQGSPGRGSQAWEEMVDTFNFFETAYIFRMAGGLEDYQEDTLIALAEALVDPWEFRLKNLYPDRSFSVYSAPVDAGLGTRICVTQSGLVPPPGW